MKYIYFCLSKNVKKKKCFVCKKKNCDTIDNIGTPIHWKCMLGHKPDEYFLKN